MKAKKSAAGRGRVEMGDWAVSGVVRQYNPKCGLDVGSPYTAAGDARARNSEEYRTAAGLIEVATRDQAEVRAAEARLRDGVDVPEPTVATNTVSDSKGSKRRDRARDLAADLALEKSVADAMAYLVLTDAATVSIDLSAGSNFRLLTTAAVGTNRTLTVVGGKPGQTFSVEITTDAANRTASYNTIFKFPGNVVPALTTTSGRLDRLVGQVMADGTVDAQMRKDVR